MDAIAAAWRENLLATLSPFCNLPILLSGGMDSATLVAAALELGTRPKCYSFRLGGQDSQDVRVARKICRDHDLALHVLDIPRSPHHLIADVRRIIGLLRTSRKAAVQCAHPMMYLARKINDDGHTTAIVGTGGICEDNRKSAVLLAQEGEEAVRELRRKNLMEFWGSATGEMLNMAHHMGVILVQPYATEPLASHGLSLDLAEINRPRQKGIALRAFPDFFQRGYWRQNSPLQVNSGIREWHDTLLASEHNKRGVRRVSAIYADILKEMQ